jgi:DNA polymerase I-like protein with 3'-5' exonuclease and polymerase domains
MLYALDIETTGLNPWKDKILCIGVYCFGSYKKVFRDLNKFKKWFADNPDLVYVTHNGKFDWKFLLVNGLVTLDQVECQWTQDTQYLAHVIKTKIPEQWLLDYDEERTKRNKELPTGIEHRKAKGLSLKTLVPFFLGYAPFWEDPTNHDNDEYVLKDCEYTFDLLPVLRYNATEQDVKFYLTRMMPWAKMLLKAELKGISIDLELLDKMTHETQDQIIALKEVLDTTWGDIHEAWNKKQVEDLDAQYRTMRNAALEKMKAPTPEKREKLYARYRALYDKAVSKLEPRLNYDSPAQMLWLIKDHLKLDATTYKGEDSTGKAILERLANDGYKEFKTLLEYREAQKLHGSFLEPYREKHINGVIHPTYNLCGTRTGRLSSSEPNLQQVTGGLYPLFLARPGKTLCQYDMEAIEAKLIAYYSDDKVLTELVQKGLSIHDVNAIDIFDLKCEPKEVKKLHLEERNAAKRLGFSCFYGAGWRRIQQALQEVGFRKTDKECKDILSRLKKRFEGAFRFHDEITAQLLDGHEVINLLGRPLYIERPEDVYMKGFNTLIQSSASDLVLESARRSGQDVLLLVHDFIGTEVPLDCADKAAKELTYCMTNYKLTNALGPIKLTVDGCVNERWTK